MKVAKPPLGDVLGCRVHRREPDRLGAVVEVVRGDREAVAVRAAPDSDRRARSELALEPGLVEPRRLELAGLVGDARGEDLQTTPPSTRRRANDSLDHCFLLSEEVADPLRGHGLVVAAGRLPEHIADGLEPEPTEPARERRSDPLKRLDGRLECAPAPARIWAWARCQVGTSRRSRPAASHERASRPQPHTIIGPGPGRLSGVDRIRVQPARLPAKRALHELVEVRPL